MKLNKTSIQMVLLFTIIVSGIFIRINVSMKHCVPNGDEGPWLRLAARLPDLNFMVSQVIEHDLCKYASFPHPEDNRSPLFPLLIYIVHLFIPDLFTSAKILNIFSFLILAVFFTVWLFRNYGFEAAIGFALFSSLSPHLIIFSSQAYPDMIVALFFFISLKNGITRTKMSKVRVLAVSFIVALTILIKTTGVFLIPVIAYLIYKTGNNHHSVKMVLLFICMVLIMILPWLMSNCTNLGSPLFQISGYLLYLDSFNDLICCGAQPPSMITYLANIGIGGILNRLVSGTIAIICNFPKFDHNLSLALLPFIISGGLAARKKIINSSFLLFSILYIPFMAYIEPATWTYRFMILYFFILYCLAAIGYQAAYNYAKLKLGPYISDSVMILITATVLFFTVMYPVEFYISKRGSSSDQDQRIRQFIEDLSSKVQPDTFIASSFLNQYAFLHSFNIINTLPYDSIEQYIRILHYYKAAYIALDRDRDKMIIYDLMKSDKIRIKPIDERAQLVLYTIDGWQH